MRTLRIILIASLFGPGSAAFAQETLRQVRFASVRAHTVVNEVTAGDRFYFEKCDFFHLDGVNVFDELARQPFVDCNMLGLSRPVAEREKTLLKLNEAFARRRRELGDPSALVGAARGALKGFLVGGVGGVIVNRFSNKLGMFKKVDPVDAFVAAGGFLAVASGWTSARQSIGSRGKNKRTLDLFDAAVPTSLYLLDQRTDDRGTQLRAMDHITDVVTRTMAEEHD